ncbi:MAG: methyltransferase domain-containing protein [Spirochaetales bacterium]|nr:methyltransferase domain-containing protein [Leptospiraceae bacterium]MCP5483668.1 methyltransferase domain-containing protein [Spirochaetales bacterium]
MRGRPYYEEPEYHTYLLSRDRRDLFPRHEILSQIHWRGVKNLLDFGMGNGYFLSTFYEFIESDCEIWGAEAQEIMIDQALQRKVHEDLKRFIPFYIERTEHPLLPDWIPVMDLVFCSCVLSTFADPSLAVRGVGRAMKPDGKMIVIDWEKIPAPSGPELEQKVSSDRMRFFIEDAGYQVTRTLRTNRHIYAFEIEKGDEARKDTDTAFLYLDY